MLGIKRGLSGDKVIQVSKLFISEPDIGKKQSSLVVVLDENGEIISVNSPQNQCFGSLLESLSGIFMPRHKKWRGIMLYPPNF